MTYGERPPQHWEQPDPEGGKAANRTEVVFASGGPGPAETALAQATRGCGRSYIRVSSVFSVPGAYRFRESRHQLDDGFLAPPLVVSRPLPKRRGDGGKVKRGMSPFHSQGHNAIALPHQRDQRDSVTGLVGSASPVSDSSSTSECETRRVPEAADFNRQAGDLRG